MSYILKLAGINRAYPAIEVDRNERICGGGETVGRKCLILCVDCNSSACGRVIKMSSDGERINRG
jgi:hypothetical protein